MSKTARADATTRIVSVCVLGQHLENIERNAERQELLQRAIHEISNRGWSNIDAVVLPGGFFCLDKYLGPLPYTERVTALENTSFHKVCTSGCQYLRQSSPSVIIAIGIDTSKGPEEFLARPIVCCLDRERNCRHRTQGVSRKSTQE